MRWIKKFSKVIVFDTLAVLCFIGVILFGWLPGPGGIPLFFLGLSLLAVNHDWAERLLETVKLRGMSIKRWIFPNIRWVQISYDIVAITAMIMSAILIYNFDSRFIEAFAVLVICFSLFVFLVNRDRFESLSKIIRKIKRKFKRILKGSISIK